MSSQPASSALTESGFVAHVRFRVRCETLGHGEEVFLVAAPDASHHSSRKVGVSWSNSECDKALVNYEMRFSISFSRLILIVSRRLHCILPRRSIPGTKLLPLL